jgi:hypothetical protein
MPLADDGQVRIGAHAAAHQDAQVRPDLRDGLGVPSLLLGDGEELVEEDREPARGARHHADVVIEVRIDDALELVVVVGDLPDLRLGELHGLGERRHADRLERRVGRDEDRPFLLHGGGRKEAEGVAAREVVFAAPRQVAVERVRGAAALEGDLPLRDGKELGLALGRATRAVAEVLDALGEKQAVLARPHRIDGRAERVVVTDGHPGGVLLVAADVGEPVATAEGGVLGVADDAEELLGLHLLEARERAVPHRDAHTRGRIEALADEARVRRLLQHAGAFAGARLRAARGALGLGALRAGLCVDIHVGLVASLTPPSCRANQLLETIDRRTPTRQGRTGCSRRTRCSPTKPRTESCERARGLGKEGRSREGGDYPTPRRPRKSRRPPLP